LQARRRWARRSASSAATLACGNLRFQCSLTLAPSSHLHTLVFSCRMILLLANELCCLAICV
jgi:hypothetical protein